MWRQSLSLLVLLLPDVFPYMSQRHRDCGSGGRQSAVMRGPRCCHTELVYREGPATVLCLRGGMCEDRGHACNEDDRAQEGPRRLFRDFEAPQDATTKENFIHAAEERDAAMDHPEFERYAETIKDGGDTPAAQRMEEMLQALVEEENRRKSSGDQVSRVMISPL